jgi:hypothetical protein
MNFSTVSGAPFSWIRVSNVPVLLNCTYGAEGIVYFRLRLFLRIVWQSCIYIYIIYLPCVLQICGATMLNLSLLTADMWAVLIRIFAYHEKVWSVAFSTVPNLRLIFVSSNFCTNLSVHEAPINCTYCVCLSHGQVDWMYFVAFGCTAGGLLVYSYR